MHTIKLITFVANIDKIDVYVHMCVSGGGPAGNCANIGPLTLLTLHHPVHPQ